MIYTVGSGHSLRAAACHFFFLSAMVRGWTSSVFHEPKGDDGRQRDVFPLPLLKAQDVFAGNVCRSVRQRIKKKHGQTIMVNKAIHALNSLFYGGSHKFKATYVDSLVGLPEIQKDAIKGIVSRVSELGPSPCASRAEALKVLRASDPSGYEEPGVDTGSTVAMCLDSLSLPDSAVGGVNLVASLSGDVQRMVVNFEDYMLEDASKWSDLTDVGRSVEPYNDPLLSSRSGYIDFLSKLYSSGVLNFSDQCRGRVGAFCVAKKPKMVNGETIMRQRLVLDCRQTNLVFKTPPHTRLGSLSALADAELPDGSNLYVAGADIRDCFYAVHMETGLQQFFGLKWNVTGEEVSRITKGQHSGFGDNTVPVIQVLPMGFSWSFFLVQHLHSEVALRSLGLDEKFLFLDGKPPPSFTNSKVSIMPYCDNLHSISIDQSECQAAKDRMVDALGGIGFDLHEHVEACTVFPTLGGVIDGVKGQVRPTNKRIWQIIHAFELAACSTVSPKTIQRLLGHSMFISVLNRAGMSVFRKLYDYAATTGPSRMLHPSERDECLIFAGIAPLLISDIRREWSGVVTCSDASPEGFGICQRIVDCSTARAHGRWSERWRFRRLPVSQWKPRERAEGWDSLGDVRTVVGSQAEPDPEDVFVANDDFPEIPDKRMDPSFWSTVKMGKWGNTKEHITLKEGRALLIAVRRLSRSSSNRCKRHLILLDNLALVFSVAKGRSHSYELLRILQKIGSISLACQLTIRLRWVRAEVNVADAPSRGRIQPGSGGSKGFQSSDTAKAGSEDSQQEAASSFIEAGCAGQEEDKQLLSQCQGADSEEGIPQASIEDQKFAKHPGSGVGGSWDEGANQPYDSPGAEECELRNSVPISGLLSQVKGLLDGERPRLATSTRRGRLGACRLHGHPFPRKESSSRRRKDSGCVGVLPARVEGDFVAQQKGIEGLEEVHASPVASPSPKSLDVRDGNVDVPQRSPRHGPHDDHCVRPLLEARRSAVAGRKEHHCSSGSGWVPVQDGDGGGSRLRGWCPRQSGYLRQFIEAGQSQHGLDWDMAPEEGSSSQLPGVSCVQLQDGGLSEGVCESGPAPRCGESTPIPAEAWGSVSGLEQPFPRPSSCQDPRQVGHRPVSETLCKDRSCPTTVDQTESSAAELLHLVRKQHQKGVPRHDSGSDSALSGCPFPDVFTMKHRPRAFCLEIFAGTARVTTALRRLGIQTFPIDTCLFSSHDVLDKRVEHSIVHFIRSGRVKFVWLGMPCTTFSRARRDDGLGPGPLRTDQYIWGLPDLCSSDRRKLQTGNALFLFTLRIVELCEQYHIPYVIENPFSSMAWDVPRMRRFIAKYNCAFCELDFCMYGEYWKKPTRLLYNFLDMSVLSRRCNSTTHICSRTSKPHTPLKGRHHSGKFWTLVAQPYPWDLAHGVASVLAKALRG